MHSLSVSITQCHATHLIYKHYHNYLVKSCVITLNILDIFFRLVKTGFHNAFQINNITELPKKCHRSTAKLLQEDKRKAIYREYITVRQSVKLIYSKCIGIYIGCMIMNLALEELLAIFYGYKHTCTN